MPDFRRKDRARRLAPTAAGPTRNTQSLPTLSLLLALTASMVTPPALAQVVVDSSVLNTLGPAENVPGLLQGPVARTMNGGTPWQSPPSAMRASPTGASAGILPDGPSGVPRSRLHVAAPPTLTASRQALTAAAPAALPRMAPPARRSAPAQTMAAPEPRATRPAPSVPVAAMPAPRPALQAVPQPAPQPTPQATSVTRVAAETPPPRAVEPPLAPRPMPAAPPPAEAPASAPGAAAPAPAPQAVAALPHATPGAVSIPFAGDGTTLPAPAQQPLRQIAGQLMSDAGAQAQVLAYASAGDGNASRARRISLARALETRGFLLEQGVPSERIEVRALGDNAPGGAPDRVDVVLVTP